MASKVSILACLMTMSAGILAGPAAGLKGITHPHFYNHTVVEREGSALNLKLPTFPSVPSVAPTGTGCTSNNQSNQCSSGIPYCCSPDGDGGHVCQNSSVSCQQTIICCNNFNGMQFCMGNMDFNMPITINLNLGKKK